jgi:hypothetical protein
MIRWKDRLHWHPLSTHYSLIIPPHLLSTVNIYRMANPSLPLINLKLNMNGNHADIYFKLKEHGTNNSEGL